MRGMLAGLVIAFIIVVVALLIAALGAVGVAAIGLLLSKLFDLTQWQGSLIALSVALGVGFTVYRLAAYTSPAGSGPEWVDWEDMEEEEVGQEPPVVAWRRRRPTQGELPSQKPSQKGQHPK